LVFSVKGSTLVSDTITADPGTAAAPGPGLAARLLGVIFSPHETFAAVGARPRALGALAVTAAVMIGCQMAFMSTDVGRNAVLDQQVRTMESFGMTVTDEMYAGMETQLDRATYTINPVATLVSVPLITAAAAGLLLGVFTMLLGGSATFKHVYAIVAHAGVVIALQQLFSTPLSYARGEMAGANLGVFVPMLEETSVVALFLGAIDLFLVWWMVILAIGIGVVYRRRTGPVATGLLSVYAVIALLLAMFRAGS
jgi:hypothetical protein